MESFKITAAETSSPNRIRSFIRRQGRITAAQSRALENLWPLYGLEPEEAFDPLDVFGRAAPLVLEIGFGNGDSLADMAAVNPEADYIGIEVHKPGVGHLLLRLGEAGLANVRVYCADAVEILSQRIADASLESVFDYRVP